MEHEDIKAYTTKELWMESISKASVNSAFFYLTDGTVSFESCIVFPLPAIGGLSHNPSKSQEWN